jgi:hypothetical protein
MMNGIVFAVKTDNTFVNRITLPNDMSRFQIQFHFTGSVIADNLRFFLRCQNRKNLRNKTDFRNVRLNIFQRVFPSGVDFLNFPVR